MTDFALRLPIFDERRNRPTEHIDETGGDGHAVDVDVLRGRLLCEITDGRDAFALNRDIGDNRGFAGTIVNGSATKNDVVVSAMSLPTIRKQ